MDVRRIALVAPAAAAALVAAAVLHGGGSRYFLVLAVTGLLGIAALATAAILRRAVAARTPPPAGTGDGPVQLELELRRLRGAALATDGPSTEADAAEVREGDILQEPPPLPATALRPHGAASAANGPAALLGDLRELVARAASGTARLRLTFPPGHLQALQHLDGVERSLRDAEALLAAATSPIAPAAPQDVDLDALLADALAMLAGADARIRVLHERGAGRALADPAQLRQALRHLVRLSVSRMPFGGALSLRARATGGRLVVEIADTGASVGPEPGVDLPLAQRLITAQGGTLSVERSAGRGTRTRIVLPAAPARHVAGA